MYDMKQLATMLKGAADTELEVTRLLAVSGLTTETLITRFMEGWELTPPRIESLTSSIHITTDGATVHAVQKEGGVIKRAKAVCSPIDTFDFTVGARLALDRLFNIVDVVREVSRPAKVGEWVKVVAPHPSTRHGYSEGDIFKVEILDKTDRAGTISIPYYVLPSEYVVLEGYTPPKAKPEPEPEPPKFTFEDFKAGKFVVHCDTEAKAREFLAYLHGRGLRWITGVSLVGKNNWGVYKGETTYSNTNGWLRYGNVEFNTIRGFPILPYNPLDLD